MSFASAFAPIEAEQKRQVMRDTWGHLAPARNAVYRGRIVYVCGVYDSGEYNPTVIYDKLVSPSKGVLDGSPWYYEALHEFLRSFESEVGVVYEWNGQFRNFEFTGVRKVLIDTNKQQ